MCLGERTTSELRLIGSVERVRQRKLMGRRPLLVWGDDRLENAIAWARSHQGGIRNCSAACYGNLARTALKFPTKEEQIGS